MVSLMDRTAPILDGHDYPRRWTEYVGQERAVQLLQVSAKSARLRNASLPHALIAHPAPGIGKTALAILAAGEMRSEVRVVSGPCNRDKARMIFANMKDRDVLFYDEGHQVMDNGRKDAEWLLTYLQDGYIAGPLGPEVQPQVTIIMATTDPQKLPESIVSRFPLQPPMALYTVPEAAKIARTMSKKVLVAADLPPVGSKDAILLAEAAHNNPRAIHKLLDSLRDLTITGELPMAKGRYDVAGMLEFHGITHDGLDNVAQDYLRALSVDFGGTAGAKAMEDRLSQPGGLRQIERMLMEKGLVAKTRTGRTITQAGIKRWLELGDAA